MTKPDCQPPTGCKKAEAFCRCSSWQNSRCSHVCPLNLRAAEAPSKCTSLVGSSPLPAVVAVSHLQPFQGKTHWKADLPCLPIPPGSEVVRGESRLKGCNARSDPQGSSNWGYWSMVGKDGFAWGMTQVLRAADHSWARVWRWAASQPVDQHSSWALPTNSSLAPQLSAGSHHGKARAGIGAASKFRMCSWLSPQFPAWNMNNWQTAILI